MRGGGLALLRSLTPHSTTTGMLSSAGVCGSHQGISRVRYGQRKAARTARYALPYPTAACSRLQPQHRCRCSVPCILLPSPLTLTAAGKTTSTKRRFKKDGPSRPASPSQHTRSQDRRSRHNKYPTSVRGDGGLVSPKSVPPYVCTYLPPA